VLPSGSPRESPYSFLNQRPRPFNADQDPAFHVYADLDPAFHFNADPDPAFHFNADPDPAVHFNADPDPAPLQTDGNLRSLRYSIDPPGLHFEPPGSIVCVHGPILSL
jgi:hypothetical protein